MPLPILFVSGTDQFRPRAIIASDAAIGSGVVTSGIIGDGAVVSGSIASGQISWAHFSSGLASGLVLSGQIGSGQISAAHISSGTVIGTAGVSVVANAVSINVSIPSGGIQSGQIGNNAVLSGNIGSGQVWASHLASGFILPGANITITPGLSGYLIAATGSSLASGSVQSGNIGNNAVTSGNIASGQISTFHLASGTKADQAEWLIDDTYVTAELISGVRSVAFNGSGQLWVAMAQVSGRIPAVGLVTANVASGQPATMYRFGRLDAGTSLNYSGSILASISGKVGQTWFVNYSGDLTTSAPVGSGVVVQPLFWPIDASGKLWVSVNSDNAFAIGNSLIGLGQGFSAIPFTFSVNSISSGYLNQFNVNAAVISGYVGSGAIIGQGGAGAFNIGSGTISTNDLGNQVIKSGNLASGIVGRFFLASGAVNSGQIASGAVVGQAGGGAFNVASGTLSTNDFASGAKIDYSEAVYDDSFTAAETISGVRFVALNYSGNMVVANLNNMLFNTSGNTPAIGIAFDNIASGSKGRVYTHGRVYNVSGWLYSGSWLTNTYSGALFPPAVAGINTQMVITNRTSGTATPSFSFDQSNPLNGDETFQTMGFVFNASGFFINPQAPFGLDIAGGLIPGNGLNLMTYTLSNIPGNKLGSGCIISGKIGAGAVIGFAGGAVVDNIASGSIGRFDIGSGQIWSGHISSGSVGHFAISSGAINSGQVASGAVIGQGGGGAFNIGSGTLNQFDLGNGVVLSGNIGSGQVWAAHLASGFILPGSNITITPGLSGYLITAAGSSLSSGSVQSGNIGNAAVTSGNIASGQVTWQHFASGVPCVIFSGTAPTGPTIGEFWLDTSIGSSTASGAVTSGMIGDNSINWNNIASGVIFSGGALNFTNYLLNGGFWFPVSTANTAFSSGLSGGDALACASWDGAVSSGGSVLFQQWDRLASGWASGVAARYYGQFQVGASGHKIAAYQTITANDSQGLANKTITFQLTAKSPTSGTLIRVGVLQTTSGVTADVVPNSLVSGWSVGTSGTDPTWGSGVALLGTATTVQLTNNWSITTVTTNSLSGGVCLIPTIWANNPLASGTQLHFTEIGLYED